VRAPYRQAYVSTPQTSGMAIAALTLGLFSCLFPAGLVGIILGIVALVQIGNSRGQLKGQGMAIAGIICAIMIPLIFLPAILFPVFAKAREKARVTTCMSHQREIAMAIMMYAQDNNEVLPSDMSMLNLSPKTLQCSSKPDLAVGYGYNSNLINRSLGDISTEDMSVTLLTADSNAANNFISSPTDIDLNRHDLHYVDSFIDGHVAYCLPAQQVLFAPEHVPSYRPTTRAGY
jgi:hypothetical protein